MKRLYYLTDSMDTAELISKRLFDAGLSNWNFHILSKDEAGVYRRHLHAATPYHRRDIIRIGERGALIGAAVGLLAATITVSIMQESTTMELVVFAVLSILVTMFGAWEGGLMGVAMENHKIARFHDDIENGQHLLMIDVPASQVGNIQKLMRQYDARPAGEDSPLIAPFDSVNA